MVKSWLLQILIAFGYALLEFAARHQAKNDTSSPAGGPPGERERLLLIIRDRLRKDQDGVGSSNSRRNDSR